MKEFYALTYSDYDCYTISYIFSSEEEANKFKQEVEGGDDYGMGDEVCEVS